MSRPEYIPLSDAAARAVAGPASRHAALIEDAFNVLIETPGGGVSVDGDAKSRAGAKQAVSAVAAMADSGRDVTEADVRVAIGNARNAGLLAVRMLGVANAELRAQMMDFQSSLRDVALRKGEAVRHRKA